MSESTGIRGSLRVAVTVLVASVLAAGLSGPGTAPAGAVCRAPSFTYRHGIVVFLKHGHTTRVRVEIADTEDAREVGLMCRTTLDPDAGMLFVFPDMTQESFWMKNTLIPLSIGFMDAGWHIVRLMDMKVEPDPSNPSQFYAPPKPYRYALEVNQGFFKQHEIDDKAEVLFLPQGTVGTRTPGASIVDREGSRTGARNGPGVP